ncbi:endoproteinase ArgC [Acidovorax sp. SRB_14]|uniref:trypsin-like serine peptidase n=1 Tax=Acidovorax sp. SRB_14 TaxID=1962699 RepID=UPI001564CDEA|nr:trypsin-like peptidase domain-containing protein [Acidovorax sp. SRB_14]NMM81288.1 endoproteinase ArgC [Acidovorax sp. SRB_14]
MTTSRTLQWIGAVAAALGLAACGGGGTPEPATAFVPSADRIEPFDPAVGRTRKALAAAELAPLPALAAASVRLGPLAASALPLPKKAAAALGKGARQQIGVARAVSATATAAALRAQLQWQDSGRGTQRAALSFEAEGAHGVRLGLRVRDLPAGAVLRFYGQAGAQVFEVSGDEVLRTLARNRQAGEEGEAARTYWSPDFGGAETTLELELPAGADLDRLDLAVPTLSHFFVAPDQVANPSLAKVGEAGSCNVDVTCRPEYSAESRSVARMLFMEADGRAFLCTGTLLNDANFSATPYFLSAHHCISTQAAASSLSTDWFYRASACNSGQPYAGAQRLHGGAALLYAEAATDTAFMRLNAPPPAGIVFAGSYFGAVDAGAAVASIHHPEGDLQKLNEGAVRRFENCTLEACTASTPQTGRFLTVGWSTGTTEGGSSGAGLFLPIGPRRYIAGQLLGGVASCQNPGGDERFGRFDLAFHAALKTWLKPDAASPPPP